MRYSMLAPLVMFAVFFGFLNLVVWRSRTLQYQTFADFLNPFRFMRFCFLAMNGQIVVPRRTKLELLVFGCGFNALLIYLA